MLSVHLVLGLPLPVSLHHSLQYIPLYSFLSYDVHTKCYLVFLYFIYIQLSLYVVLFLGPTSRILLVCVGIVWISEGLAERYVQTLRFIEEVC